MERTISAEERIRRAEEIYQRRKMQGGVRVSSRNVNTKSKPEFGMFKKLALQIAICSLIYFIFYLIQNSNYIFSDDVITKTREFLSYDINFQQVFNDIGNYFNKNITGFFKNNDSDEENNNEQLATEIMQNQIETDEVTENVLNENEITENKDTQNNEDSSGVGGGEEGENLLVNEVVSEIVKETSADENTIQPLTQMEIDANNIKENYSLIVPLNGFISSRFGPRTATNIVSANHAGIDIAANEGTVFIASMNGTVTYVSGTGGYGNHVYIEKDDVTTLYAHCKTIYVKEGDIVTQGQQIGEVGQTGNATGPHLHFEIRKASRVVNPEYILEF